MTNLCGNEFRLNVLFLFLLCLKYSFAYSSDIVDPLNYKGKNICLAITKPDIRGRDYEKVKTPKIISESALNSQSAKHVVKIDDVGEIDITENLVASEECKNLPLDKFLWNDSDLSSRARFCLTSFSSDKKIMIEIIARTSDDRLKEAKAIVSALAPCHFNKNLKTYYADEVFSSGNIVELGSYIVGKEK